VERFSFYLPGRPVSRTSRTSLYPVGVVFDKMGRIDNFLRQATGFLFLA
jgi:hypothetical protein